MKKVFVSMICCSMLLSSCYTTGDGAITGAHFGALIGSAIGGISGGPRGHDVGLLTGLAVGAVTGAAIGTANESEERESVRGHYQNVVAPRQQSNNNYGYSGYSRSNGSDSGYDPTNSGDDRLYDFKSSDYTGNYSAATPTTTEPATSKIGNVSLKGLSYSNAIEISNARFVDTNNDGALNAGEDAKIIFEFKNVSRQTLTNIVPVVLETTGNKKIMVSGSLHVESLEPGHTLRYTAIVLAKKSLKTGNAHFAISVESDNNAISKVTEFDIKTEK